MSAFRFWLRMATVTALAFVMIGCFLTFITSPREVNWWAVVGCFAAYGAAKMVLWHTNTLIEEEKLRLLNERVRSYRKDD